MKKWGLLAPFTPESPKLSEDGGSPAWGFGEEGGALWFAVGGRRVHVRGKLHLDYSPLQNDRPNPRKIGCPYIPTPSRPSLELVPESGPCLLSARDVSGVGTGARHVGGW